MTNCRHCGNMFPVRNKWFRHEQNYCTILCWEQSQERIALLKQNQGLFDLDSSEKQKIIKNISSDPFIDDRSSLWYELSKSIK